MALDDAGRDAVRPASVMFPAASVLVHDGHDALVKRREMVGDVLSRVTSVALISSELASVQLMLRNWPTLMRCYVTLPSPSTHLRRGPAGDLPNAVWQIRSVYR